MVEGQAHRSRPKRARLPGVAGWLALCLAALPTSLGAEPCTPWPGEPTPLPQVADPDEMRARWATLRVRELAGAARDLEARAPIRAHGLWRRVLCLDPRSEAAAAGLARTPLLVIHAPEIIAGGDETEVGDAWAGLSIPVTVAAAPAPSPPPPRDTRKADFEKALSDVEQRVRAAQFESALESAERARSAVVALGADADRARRARLEVLAATAALALGRSDAAAASFARALEADPDLELDPTRTSPKVRRAFERARRTRTP